MNSIPLCMFCSSGPLVLGCFCLYLSWTVLFPCQILRVGFLDIAILVGSYVNAAPETHHSMLSLILGFLMKELMLF